MIFYEFPILFSDLLTERCSFALQKCVVQQSVRNFCWLPKIINFFSKEKESWLGNGFVLSISQRRGLMGRDPRASSSVALSLQSFWVKPSGPENLHFSLCCWLRWCCTPPPLETPGCPSCQIHGLNILLYRAVWFPCTFPDLFFDACSLPSGGKIHHCNVPQPLKPDGAVRVYCWTLVPRRWELPSSEGALPKAASELLRNSLSPWHGL